MSAEAPSSINLPLVSLTPDLAQTPAPNLATLVRNNLDPWGVLTTPIEYLAAAANCELESVERYLRGQNMGRHNGYWMTNDAKASRVEHPYPSDQIKAARERRDETLIKYKPRQATIFTFK